MDANVLEQALNEFPTPFYLFDEGELHRRIAHLQSLVGARAHLCYAMKANSFIVQQAARDVYRFEVCSPGELRICQEQGIPDEKLVISGVVKDEELMRELVFEHPAIARYTIESLSQFDMLERLATQAACRIPVLIRLTSGNQFGVNAQEVKDLVLRAIAGSAIEFCGVQFFSGTQKTSLKRLKRELTQVDNLIAQLEEECGAPVRELEFGPGFPVMYFDSEEEAAVKQDELAKGFGELLADLRFKGEVSLEMGRAIAASCGTYVTRFVDLKTNAGENYALVDGGKHQIAYFGNALAMNQPPCWQYPAREGEEVSIWNICGSLCTVNDILAKQLPLRAPVVGDALVFERAGAYCMTEGISLFLSRDLPRVVLRDASGALRLARDSVQTYVFNNPAC